MLCFKPSSVKGDIFPACPLYFLQLKSVVRGDNLQSIGLTIGQFLQWIQMKMVCLDHLSTEK